MAGTNSPQDNSPKKPAQIMPEKDGPADVYGDHSLGETPIQNGDVKDLIPVRVSLSRVEDDGNTGAVAQEAFMLNANVVNRRTLVENVRDEFHNLERGYYLRRTNIPDDAIWGKGLKSIHIKAIWDTGAAINSSWSNGLSQTEITDANLHATIQAFKKSPPSTCALSFQLARIIPSDLRDLLNSTVLVD